jgi:flavin reductase (DIM6/NTAB) family NADH-FMN oxidoreductase RutF
VESEHTSSVGADEFSTFVEGLDYPLYVVTTTHDGERSGCLVGFTTQVSIDPPQMLVCISKKNHTHRLALDADLFAVHLLSPDQQSLAELFGEETGDQVDKFERCSWRPGIDDVPVLDGAARHMIGRVLQRVPFADHLGLLLEPVTVSVSSRPVAYSLEDAADMEPGHSA